MKLIIQFILLNGLFICLCSLARVEAKNNEYLFSLKWGKSGSTNGKFVEARGIEIDNKDDVYVVDTGNHRVQKFDQDGNFELKWGTEGTENGKFSSPCGIAIDQQLNIYVVDTGNNRIQKFDRKGNFILKWGKEGKGKAEFNWPYEIAIHNDNVYVTDSANHRVQKFDSAGNYLLGWGQEGRGDGQFGWPTGITIDRQGNIYVADSENACIQKFNSTGQLIAKWLIPLKTNDNLRFPLGLTVDGYNQLYLSASRENYIQKFDSKGKPLWKLGGKGKEEGTFSFPCSLAINGINNLYVLDSRNNRVQSFVRKSLWVRPLLPKEWTGKVIKGLPWATLIAGLWLLDANSHDSGKGTVGAEFLLVGLSARTVAMGETAAGVTDGLEGMFWNAGSLAKLNKLEASFTHLEYLDNITLENFGYGQRIGRYGVMGLWVESLNSGKIDKTEIDGSGNLIERGDSFQTGNLLLGLGYSLNWRQKYGLGLVFKGIEGKIENEKSQTYALDLGCVYQLSRKLRLGLSIQNMGKNLKYVSEADPLPLRSRLGVGYKFSEQWIVGADMVDEINEDRLNTNFGIEYNFRKLGSVRIGYSSDRISSLGALAGLSLGSGLKFSDYNIDYAFVPYGDLGYSHRISWLAKF